MTFVQKFILPLMAFTMIAVMMTACAPTIAQRGNMLADHQIEKIVPSIHTRADVLRILGSPTNIATFDDNTWYYIGQETEKKGILDAKITQERIVVVQFDENGVVRDVQDADTQRAKIPVERSKTPTHGNEVTAIQQMLGNLGKFNPNSGKK